MATNEASGGIGSAARVLQRLIDARLEFVVIGGIAALVHGSTMVTRDIDICLRFDAVSLRLLSATLRDLHPKHRLSPQRFPLEIREDNWNDFKNLYLETDWGVLDCLGEVAGIGRYEEALAQSVAASLPFGQCRVLTIEALIRAKEAVGRPNDLRTAAELRMIAKKKERPEAL
jgi:hypothetical protein